MKKMIIKKNNNNNNNIIGKKNLKIPSSSSPRQPGGCYGYGYGGSTCYVLPLLLTLWREQLQINGVIFWLLKELHTHWQERGGNWKPNSQCGLCALFKKKRTPAWKRLEKDKSHRGNCGGMDWSSDKYLRARIFPPQASRSHKSSIITCTKSSKFCESSFT